MSFKPITLSDTTTVASTYDPAVDRDRIIANYLEKNPEWVSNDHLDDDSRKMLAWQCFEADFLGAVGRRPSESLDMLLVKDGESLTKFVIGAVRPEDLNRIYDETRETQTHRGKNEERCWRAFVSALRDIQGWPGDVKKRKVGDVEYVDPVWLSRNFVRGLRAVGIQVGMVILGWNEMTDLEVENL